LCTGGRDDAERGRRRDPRDDGVVTIHSGHPFATPEPERDPARRLRGRLTAPVTLWTSLDAAGDRVGLTVSSMLIADGQPSKVLALLDPDSDLWEAVEQTRTAAVQLLGWPHRSLADAFAGLAPAPGGPFRMASWIDTAWGPVLHDASAWAGVRLVDAEPGRVGWAVAAEAVVEHVELADDVEPLVHRRGRYVRLVGST
jgi:flavin reductase (DIM6/NTAB) family NADH-FMN oxidoreductase RutF